jgi:glycosyltransferase involved in cell wall biosynthesis
MSSVIFKNDKVKDRIQNTDNVEQPLVSVITVCFNLILAGRKDHFIQCVESVRLQAYPHVEHLVIDGGSDDGTVELIQSLNVDFVSEPDSGIYDAMNKGIARARGRYVCFLNSDDFFHDAEGITESVKCLLRTGAAFSYAKSTILLCEENGKHLVKKSNYMRVLWRMPFCHPSMFCDRLLLIREGMFDLTFKSAGDYDLIVRLFLRGYKAVCVDKCFVTFRMGGISNKDLVLSKKEKVDIFEKNYSPYVNLTRKQWEDFSNTPILPFPLYQFYPFQYFLWLLCYRFFLNGRSIIKSLTR